LFLHYLAFVSNFTHLLKKLVFSLNSGFGKFMSKLLTCVHQVPENANFAAAAAHEVFEFIANLVQCGGLMACVAGLAGCNSHTETRLNGGHNDGDVGVIGGIRILKRGLPGEPQTLDPQLADDTYSFQVVRDMYEGLTAEDRYGQIVPGIANSWTVDKTGTIYTFHLRQNAKWSDGTRILADEFVLGLRRAVDPKTASGSAALLEVIKGASEITAGRKGASDLGVAAVGESEVQIELERPAPFVLQILSQPIAAPVHLMRNGATAASPGEKYAATNGPYVLASRIPNSLIELKRNPYYWDSANVAIEDIRYINVESEATELREYAAGQLDLTFTIPTSDLKRISQQYGAQVQTAPILGTFYLALNLSQPPMKNNEDLRQALSMAVDREAIAQQVLVDVTPAYAFVAKGISGYAPPEYPWSKWTRDRQLTYAKSLLERAGYSGNKTLHLKLYFNRDEGIHRVMVAVAGSWKQNLGVDSELISDEFRVFLAGRKDRSRWDVARLGWNADYDDPASFLDVFARHNGQNDPGYNSTAFNDLIDKARVEPSPSRRSILLRQSEQILLEDYPIIPVYFYKARRLVKPDLGGAEITPMNHTYSKHLFWKSPQ
ncbi:MAG: oligopeptide transporter periplasmic oligopeptide-binding protein, partial [Gammaproteobacteria bacterium]|nr:oligopeptide transporter periplasmic oligopeptide-binding protein [Gammaproteobacteria bacterium]